MTAATQSRGMGIRVSCLRARGQEASATSTLQQRHPGAAGGVTWDRDLLVRKSLRNDESSTEEGDD